MLFLRVLRGSGVIILIVCEKITQEPPRARRSLVRNRFGIRRQVNWDIYREKGQSPPLWLHGPDEAGPSYEKSFGTNTENDIDNGQDLKLFEMLMQPNSIPT